MKVELVHEGGLAFRTAAGAHSVLLDARAPIGKDSGPTPKEMLLAAVAGCSAMDVAASLRKARVTPERFVITAAGTPRSEHPRIFPRIDVLIDVSGSGIDPSVVVHGVVDSLTKYCGVSAMVAPTSPIFWRVVVNGTEAGTGQAKFDQ